MEAKINKYTRKWLGLPSVLSDVALYCRQAKLKLPLKSIVEEFKPGKIRLQMMLDDSKEEVIKSLNPTAHGLVRCNIEAGVNAGARRRMEVSLRCHNSPRRNGRRSASDVTHRKRAEVCGELKES